LKDTLSTVAYHEALGKDYFRLGLRTTWTPFTPGQFAMLQVPSDGGVLLRRPFSLARQEGEVTEILYKVVGRGTANLKKLPVGAALKILGPLGKGFSFDPVSGPRVAVAGGYGIAPFWEYAVQLKKRGESLEVFYGARSRADLLYLEELQTAGAQVHCSTEDGSEGYHGLVTDLLRQRFPEGGVGRVYSCGPWGLLKAVGHWCREQGIAGELSIEEAMGCGTGVCLGCVVSDSEGNYLRACKEGPVFLADGLDLN